VDDSQVLTVHVEKLSFDLFHLRLGDLIEPEKKYEKKRGAASQIIEEYKFI